MKIGITERGDASIDYSWTDKLDTVNGAILITKSITDYFIGQVLTHKDKLIIHCTCTGFGGTSMEPHVPTYEHQLRQAKKLCDSGFPMDKIVIRVDPIIPLNESNKHSSEHYGVFLMAYHLGFRRFRMSVIDMYPHVRNRFKQAGCKLPFGENFSLDNGAKTEVVSFLLWAKECFSDDVVIEVCAEGWLSDYPELCDVCGCISEKDIALLGCKSNSDTPQGAQRKGCLCLSCKTELLTSRTRCPNGCLYCYWKD